ncbi:MAG: putative subtilase-type serine protease precursor [Schlesneria sp.]|nr:putative subtilase-type serine protease precursor [Schlesneria sp.]
MRSYRSYESRTPVPVGPRRRRSLACGLIFCLSLAVAGFSSAQEAKPDKLPKIIVAIPLAIETGVPVKLTLRGHLLDQITEVKVGSGDLKAEIVSKGKAAVPQNYEAKRVGETQAELKFTLPAETPSGRLSLIAVNAEGVSVPYEIIIAKADELIQEKEPNDGFKTSQQISIGKTLVGTIHDQRNVDVFEIKGEAGQKLMISVVAQQAGSSMDPFLTLYDGTGQVVVGVDDNDGRDAKLEVTLAKSGSYYITVQDANDAGGPHFVYLLKVTQ